MALVMFDFDGVIVDSLEQFTSNFITACRDAGYHGLTTQQEALALLDANVYESLAKRGLQESAINEILRKYECLAGGVVSTLRLFEGMKEVLINICQKHTVYVITSNASSVPLGVLSRNGIKGIVDVLGADKEKSKIKKIRKTMEQHPSLEPYYIGDTKGDILEGKEAGVKTVGVAWGWHGRQKLEEASPEYLINEPKELDGLF